MNPLGIIKKGRSNRLPIIPSVENKINYFSAAKSQQVERSLTPDNVTPVPGNASPHTINSIPSRNSSVISRRTPGHHYGTSRPGEHFIKYPSNAAKTLQYTCKSQKIFDDRKPSLITKFWNWLCCKSDVSRETEQSIHTSSFISNLSKLKQDPEFCNDARTLENLYKEADTNNVKEAIKDQLTELNKKFMARQPTANNKINLNSNSQLVDPIQQQNFNPALKGLNRLKRDPDFSFRATELENKFLGSTEVGVRDTLLNQMLGLNHEYLLSKNTNNNEEILVNSSKRNTEPKIQTYPCISEMPVLKDYGDTKISTIHLSEDKTRYSINGEFFHITHFNQEEKALLSKIYNYTDSELCKDFSIDEFLKRNESSNLM